MQLDSWAKQLLELIGANYKVEYNVPIELETGRSYILMSNHQSYYDIPLLYMTIPDKANLRMIAKKELYRIPLWGRGLKTAEFISIDRSDHEKSMESMEAAKEKMKNGIMIYVAPEGTRSRDGKLGEFKKGGFLLAIQTESIIIPIGLRGTEKAMPPDTWDFSLGQKLEAHVGTPIDTAILVSKRGILLCRKSEIRYLLFLKNWDKYLVKIFSRLFLYSVDKIHNVGNCI